ncbi:MAG: NAD(P)H-dependent oxidoreductase [Verrucomicrobiota bacterium]
MTPIPCTTLLNQLQWRYATKKFDPSRPIPPEVWWALEETLVLAPSSFGLQPWKFLVITNPEVKQALVPCSWNQTQPADCSHHVVFCVRQGLDAAHVDRFLDRQVEIRGGSRAALEGYRNMMLGSLKQAAEKGFLDTWQTHQVYIALGQFMASAALLGVDTCPMEGIVPPEYDRVLGLAGTGYATVVACAAGYRAADDKYASAKKVRFSRPEVLQHI